MLKLMLRLYDPTEGMILVNGHDIKTLELNDLRESMAVLFQDYTHFPLTVRLFDLKHRSAGCPLTQPGKKRSRKTSRSETLEMHTMRPGFEKQRD